MKITLSEVRFEHFMFNYTRVKYDIVHNELLDWIGHEFSKGIKYNTLLKYCVRNFGSSCFKQDSLKDSKCALTKDLTKEQVMNITAFQYIFIND